MIHHAYYENTLQGFKHDSAEMILGELARLNQFALEQTQRDAWLGQIDIVKAALAHVEKGHVLFEYAIPRMGKRVDVLLYLGSVLIVVEFKVGAAAFDRAAIDQTVDYALDLKNFHKGSHDLDIVPVLVATRAADADLPNSITWGDDRVAEPLLVSGNNLEQAIRLATQTALDDPSQSYETWAASGYRPTPTIIEAAQALYGAHEVEEISRSDAGAVNLTTTYTQISDIIEHSKANGLKSICFVSGVPGAGKTLAGLNISTKRAEEHSDEHAVFLSGNGPLVMVLREALARDEKARTGGTKKDAARKVSSFIQNIHHFRDDALRDPTPPYEKVAVFDEAQRAWTRDQASKFMQVKRGQADFDMSEPEFLISVMDRHEDWAVIVCLIGGGQEINTGEAGVGEWWDALQEKFLNWRVFVPESIDTGDYVIDQQALGRLNDMNAARLPGLHLSTSLRSYRAEALSKFVHHVVENNPALARDCYAQIKDRYPIYLTRDLDAATHWLKSKARGTERYGVLASSKALRLRPEGINVKSKIDPAVWFLNDHADVRSSYYCEEAATEFDVQGLELDWACVGWDADFRYVGEKWQYRKFSGTKWQEVRQTEAQQYLKNAYRVLLTRARQGMVIVVPEGDDNDPTRSRAYYTETFEYLLACGLSRI